MGRILDKLDCRPIPELKDDFQNLTEGKEASFQKSLVIPWNLVGMGERTTFFLPWKTGQSHLFAVQPVGSEEGQVFSRDLVVDAFCSFVHLLFASFFLKMFFTCSFPLHCFFALSFPESRWMWKLQQRKRSKRRKRPQRWMGLSDVSLPHVPSILYNEGLS